MAPSTTNGFKHALLDLWLRTPLEQKHVDSVLEYVRSRYNVLKEVRQTVESPPDSLSSPRETYAFVLSESHFILSTFPDERFIALELFYSLSETKLLPMIEDIRNLLPVKRSSYTILRRGDLSQRQISRAQDEMRRQSADPFRYASKDLPLS